MTQLPALIDLLGATKKTSTGSSATFLILLLGIAVIGYFFWLRPQQRKARQAQLDAKSGIEVGDDVQTIGGIIGTVLEIHGDRYTLLTGALGEDGNLEGAQPTRIVFVRQAIARKVDRVAVQPGPGAVEEDAGDEEEDDDTPGSDDIDGTDEGSEAEEA